MELRVGARWREHHVDARRQLEVPAQLIAQVLATPVEGDLDLVKQRFVDQFLARQPSFDESMMCNRTRRPCARLSSMARMTAASASVRIVKPVSASSSGTAMLSPARPAIGPSLRTARPLAVIVLK